MVKTLVKPGQHNCKSLSLNTIFSLFLQDAEFEKFAAEVDPIEGEADQALALLDTIEALSAELDDFNEATMPAVEDLEVCYFVLL